MNDISIIEENASPAVNKALKAISRKHKKVSKIETPKAFIKKKQGFNYVDIGYMRSIANENFPGYSWEIINSEALGSEAYVVHGRLTWYDNGVVRKGDMVAAHRIQKLKGTDKFSDVGNDIKSANTDCMKKAFNMFMNIADDIYKKQYDDLELSDEQKNTLIDAAELIDNETTKMIINKISNYEITDLNYKGSLAKLKRMSK